MLAWTRSGSKPTLLHDVDLAARRPADAADAGAEHPDGRPGAPARRQLRAHLDPPVAKLEAAERHDARGRVAVALVALLARLDHEHAVLDAHVLGAGGVVLLLVVLLQVAELVAPFRGVGAAGRVELVREHERERAAGRRAGGRRGCRARAGTATGGGERHGEREGERRELRGCGRRLMLLPLLEQVADLGEQLHLRGRRRRRHRAVPRGARTASR